MTKLLTLSAALFLAASGAALAQNRTPPAESGPALNPPIDQTPGQSMSTTTPTRAVPTTTDQGRSAAPSASEVPEHKYR
jgi:hypothetical protein